MRSRFVGLAALYGRLMKQYSSPEVIGRGLVQRCLMNMEVKAIPNRGISNGVVKIVVNPEDYKHLKLAENIPRSFDGLFDNPEASFKKKFSDLLLLLAVLEHTGLVIGSKMETEEGKDALEKFFGKHRLEAAMTDMEIDREIEKMTSLMSELEALKGKNMVGKTEGKGNCSSTVNNENREEIEVTSDEKVGEIDISDLW